MPFQKGNTLWKKGMEAYKENQSRLQRFHEILVDGGARVYGELMEDLADGNDVKAPQKEYMDRYERHLEFVTAKLARVDNNVNGSIRVYQEPDAAQKTRLKKLL